MSSLEAAAQFEDNSIDFVFIDAAHEYEFVKEDIAAWYPKVKPGGLFAGHDYNWTGVHKAVSEFSQQYNKFVYSSELCWITSK
jgi:predicted O-methyltransferase YrrM